MGCSDVGTRLAARAVAADDITAQVFTGTPSCEVFFFFFFFFFLKLQRNQRNLKGLPSDEEKNIDTAQTKLPIITIYLSRLLLPLFQVLKTLLALQSSLRNPSPSGIEIFLKVEVASVIV